MNSAIVALALLAPAQPNRIPEPPQPPAPDVRDTVRSGLKWLADKQGKDGQWTNTDGTGQTLNTAMAGLAMLMEGSTLKDGPYAPHLRKSVAWFERKAAASGLLATDRTEANVSMPNHATAMLFLLSAYDVDHDPDRARRLAKLIEKAVAFSAEGQTTRGGWGFLGAKDGNDYDDAQSTATVLQALFAARKIGFDVPQKATDRATEYLVKATNRNGGVIYSIYGGVVPAGNDGVPWITASAAAGLLMSNGARPHTLPGWVTSARAGNFEQMRGLREGGSSALIPQFQMARVCFALGEDGHQRLAPDARGANLVKWSTYRAPLFKAVKEAQSKDGSWPDPYFGPAYPTALALVILQLDNDYLPAFSR